MRRKFKSQICENGHETGGFGCYTCLEVAIVMRALATFFRAGA